MYTSSIQFPSRAVYPAHLREAFREITVVRPRVHYLRGAKVVISKRESMQTLLHTLDEFRFQAHRRQTHVLEKIPQLADLREVRARARASVHCSHSELRRHSALQHVYE